MIESARLPPIYTFIPIEADDNPSARAREMASQGSEPATLLCIDSASLLDCAVILHPDVALAKARLVVYVGMLGLGDAIGSIVPAGIDITYRWPNRIDANLGFVGQVRLCVPRDIADTASPPWLTLRATVAVSGGVPDGDAGGSFETTLVEEGAAGITTIQLLESLARHFLTWTNRWQDDGFPPIRAMWLRHSSEKGRDTEISIGSRVFRGVFETIDDGGALLLRNANTVDQIPLDAIPDD